MSEALLLAIITPIAATISALILKAWESIAKNKQRQAERADMLKNAYKDDRDEALVRLKEALADADKWRMNYMELYQKFYMLRLAHAKETQDVSSMNAISLGLAPHEREGSSIFFDKKEE